MAEVALQMSVDGCVDACAFLSRDPVRRLLVE